MLGERSSDCCDGSERDLFRDVESRTGVELVLDAGENCAHNRDNGISLGVFNGEGFCKTFEGSVFSPDMLEYEVTFKVGSVNGNSKFGLGIAIEGGTSPFGKPGKEPDGQGPEPGSVTCEECVMCGLGILTGPRTIFDTGKLGNVN